MVLTTQAPAGLKPTESSATVTDCYDFFDGIFPVSGLWDLTEGIYRGDPTVSYEQAQRNQAEWLLDEARCKPGSRILDIGCGYGRLLEAARRRGAEAVGITISPPQVRYNQAQGLDVRLLDYRDIGEDWTGQFDAVIANGSIEHFVHPQEVIDGRADERYREMFDICQRVIDPDSPSRRMVTTIIHQNRFTPCMEPEELLKGPFSFRWFSLKFHCALLQQTFGGYYPQPGQLERCARPGFRLVNEVDGTEDYGLTSEQWFSRVGGAFWRPGTALKLWRNLTRLLFRQPRHTCLMCLCLFIAESWQKQFRGPHPPTTLWRQTWQA